MKQRRVATRRDSEWANNDATVLALLERVFPRAFNRNYKRLCEQDFTPKQDKRMKRWLKAIRLYWREGATTKEVSQELRISYHVARSLIRNIRRAQAAFTSNSNNNAAPQHEDSQ